MDTWKYISACSFNGLNGYSEKVEQSGGALVNFYCLERRKLSESIFKIKLLTWTPVPLFSYFIHFFYFKSTNFLCMATLGTGAVKQKLEESVCSDCWPEGNTRLHSNAEGKWAALSYWSVCKPHNFSFLLVSLFAVFFSKNWTYQHVFKLSGFNSESLRGQVYFRNMWILCKEYNSACASEINDVIKSYIAHIQA